MREVKHFMVYVISNNGQALMPTKRFGKVRKLLKEKKAKVPSLKFKKIKSWGYQK